MANAFSSTASTTVAEYVCRCSKSAPDFTSFTLPTALRAFTNLPSLASSRCCLLRSERMRIVRFRHGYTLQLTYYAGIQYVSWTLAGLEKVSNFRKLGNCSSTAVVEHIIKTRHQVESAAAEKEGRVSAGIKAHVHQSVRWVNQSQA